MKLFSRSKSELENRFGAHHLSGGTSRQWSAHSSGSFPTSQPDPGGTNRGRGRLRLFATLALVAGAAIFLRLIWLQIVEAPKLKDRSAGQYRMKVQLPPWRGAIYDRHGMPLTDNLTDWMSVGIDMRRATSHSAIAADLSSVTGKPRKLYLDRLESPARYVVLERQVSPADVTRLKSKGWKFDFQPEMHRMYPQGRLAGQLLGFTDVDNRGLSGLEMTLNDILKGEPGWRVVQLDVEGRQHLDRRLSAKLQENGSDVFLTIDSAIQSILEAELIPALDYYRAESASGIVLNPCTGEIYALASLPGFDPNHFDQYPVAAQKNLPVTELFEPGSTFKIVAATLLLQKQLATPETVVDCGNGKIKIYNETIHDHHPYGELDMRGVITNSSNVGMIRLSEIIDPKSLYRQISEFGFLGRTGIEINGEARGRMLPPSQWSGLTKPNLVIGHSIDVTALQLAMAFAAIANEGELVKPTLVRAERDPSGKVKRHAPLTVRRVMKRKVAETLNDMLLNVVAEGTGTLARVDGLTIAGKTGTSQMVNPATGKYYQNRFHTTFAGYFPAEDPEYLCLIYVKDPHGPRGEHTGGYVAAPIFKRVAERIAGLQPELKTPAAILADRGDNLQVPDLAFKTVSEASQLLSEAGLKLSKRGSGSVIYDQVPAAGRVASAGDVVRVTLGPKDPPSGPSTVMPELTGLSLREAIRKATECGLEVRIQGSGKVVGQHPAPGSRVTVGAVCSMAAEANI